MDVAPETGYESLLNSAVTAADQTASTVLPFKFYARTRSGKYATVGGKVTAYRTGPDKALLHVGIHYNPSGSRNVEFDHTKWLNR